MKTLVMVLSLVMLSFQSVAQARTRDEMRGDSGLPTLKGQKALELMEILDKVGAAVSSCSVDNCYKRGDVDVLCKSASGTKSDVSTGCRITAAGKSAPEVNLNKERSKRMMNLLDSARATEESVDPCSMGSCHQKGSLTIDCQSPAGKNPEKEFSCAVGAVPKKAPVGQPLRDRESGSR